MEKKKSNKGLIITIVILIILLLGLAGYICYDKFLTSNKNDALDDRNQTTEELIKQNEFKLEDIECKGTDTCEKTVKLAYNGKNHEIKLIKKYNSSTKKYLIDLYEDNTLIDTINAGSYDDSEGKIVYLDENNNKKTFDPLEVVKKMDGRVYVVDSKYLGIVYRMDGITKYTLDSKPSWYLRFYNENKPYKKSILVADKSTSIIKDDNTNLHTLDALEFDGTNVKYWGYYCKDGEVVTQDKRKNKDGISYDYAAQYSAKFDGEKADVSIGQILDNVTGAGGERSCNEIWDING